MTEQTNTPGPAPVAGQPACPDEVLRAAVEEIWTAWGYRDILSAKTFHDNVTHYANADVPARIVADHAYRAGLAAGRAEFEPAATNRPDEVLWQHDCGATVWAPIELRPGDVADRADECMCEPRQPGLWRVLYVKANTEETTS